MLLAPCEGQGWGTGVASSAPSLPSQELSQSLVKGTQATKQGGGRLTTFEVRCEASEHEVEPRLMASWAKGNPRVASPY